MIIQQRGTRRCGGYTSSVGCADTFPSKGKAAEVRLPLIQSADRRSFPSKGKAIKKPTPGKIPEMGSKGSTLFCAYALATCQIKSLYSAMERSEEKKPDFAVLSTAIFSHLSRFW